MTQPSSLHVVPGLGQSQGGPSYSVPRLCRALNEAGTPTQLLAVDQDGDPPFDDVEADLMKADYSTWPILGSLRLSRQMKHELERRSRACANVHVHGFWLMPNVYAGHAARRNNRPTIVSPRGMLSQQALAFSKPKKDLFWTLFQRSAYKSAAVWHATSEQEADDIRQFGIEAPIAIIPNGVDSPDLDQAPLPVTSEKTIVFLSRLHPKKGLTNLVQAWAELAPEFPHWQVKIIGPDEAGEADRLRGQIRNLGLASIGVHEPIFGDAKWQELARAELFVLPTQSENFGIAVAEALCAGTPAIVTNRAPWSDLVTQKCGWSIEYGAAPLAEALRHAMGLTSEERAQMGARGRAWMKLDFGWNRIAEDMSKVYTWLDTGGAPPDVLFD
ncbi:MAG: glycosyltransferase [Pseudomonadota bacterium]